MRNQTRPYRKILSVETVDIYIKECYCPQFTKGVPPIAWEGKDTVFLFGKTEHARVSYRRCKKFAAELIAFKKAEAAAYAAEVMELIRKGKFSHKGNDMCVSYDNVTVSGIAKALYVTANEQHQISKRFRTTNRKYGLRSYKL